MVWELTQCWPLRLMKSHPVWHELIKLEFIHLCSLIKWFSMIWGSPDSLSVFWIVFSRLVSDRNLKVGYLLCSAASALCINWCRRWAGPRETRGHFACPEQEVTICCSVIFIPLMTLIDTLKQSEPFIDVYVHVGGISPNVCALKGLFTSVCTTD